MDWMQVIRAAVAYMEAHLLEQIDAADVAAAVHVSAFYFQRGFSLIGGCTVGEYIRNRRLYLAAVELVSGSEKIVDLALKYGYETPESFTKAFRRFHGASPAAVRQAGRGIRPFLPLKIQLSVKGGMEMDYTVEKMEAFQVVGLHRRFGYERSYAELPVFWDEFKRAGCPRSGAACTVGKYGICIDDGKQDFSYWIAGDYTGGEVPAGMETREIPAQTWAKFICTGPIPGALQSVNTQIFSEWLPGNPEWEMDGAFNIEVYDMGDCDAADYHSEIWIPVRKKEA